MPHTTRQRREMFKNEAKESRARFIHYTSAEAALSIIKSKRIWMRNTICMSDYCKVQHGFDIFSRFFAAEANRTAFIGALDQCVSGVAQEGINLFNQWWNHEVQYVRHFGFRAQRNGGFVWSTINVACIWRKRCARRHRFQHSMVYYQSLTLHLLFSPVAYLTEASADKVLLEVIENIRANREFLCTVERPQLLQRYSSRSSRGSFVLSTKVFTRRGSGGPSTLPNDGRRLSWSPLPKWWLECLNLCARFPSTHQLVIPWSIWNCQRCSTD